MAIPASLRGDTNRTIELTITRGDQMEPEFLPKFSRIVEVVTPEETIYNVGTNETLSSGKMMILNILELRRRDERNGP